MNKLPPDVRDRAARAAFENSRAISPYSGWDELPEEWREIARGEVDAVAAVVTPEIERPLKARVENLLAHNAEHRAQVDDLQEWNERLETERDALRARVAELEDRELQLQEQAGDMAEDLERERAHQKQAAIDYSNTIGPVIRENEALKARVDQLTTALTELVEYWDDEFKSPTQSVYRWRELINVNARAVLSATPTGEAADV